MNGNIECPGCGLNFEFSVEEEHYDLTQDAEENEQETFPPSRSGQAYKKEIQWAETGSKGRASKRAKIDANESFSITKEKPPGRSPQLDNGDQSY